MTAILINDTRAWVNQARCREPDSVSPFPDEWPDGVKGRATRAQALARCRTCPVALQCGQSALEDFDGGMALYGVYCHVVFTDVIPCRQENDVARLRLIVAGLAGGGGMSPIDNAGLINIICEGAWSWLHRHLCRKCRQTRWEEENHIRCYEAGLLSEPVTAGTYQ